MLLHVYTGNFLFFLLPHIGVLSSISWLLYLGSQPADFANCLFCFSSLGSDPVDPIPLPNVSICDWLRSKAQSWKAEKPVSAWDCLNQISKTSWQLQMFSFFCFFFNLKSECAGASGCVSKEIFVLRWRWGIGYLWFTAVCSQSILWSLGRAYFPSICSALEPCAVLPLGLLCHTAFPQAAHHQMPINLCLAVTEDKQELQLLSASYMLQVTKW